MPIIKYRNRPGITRMACLGVASVFALSLFFPIATVSAKPRALSNRNTSVSSSEVSSALSTVNGLSADSDTIRSNGDADSAIQAAVAGSTVDIPKDASDGITLDNPEVPAIEIGLPNADKAQNATQVATGTVAYAGNNGSANAVQATENGGVRMLTVIDNPNAPTTYDYQITVPAGGKIVLQQDGSAFVYDAKSTLIASAATPWAKDANGVPIKTYFTTDGLRLTQHVEHNVPGVAYPVTADPWFLLVGAVILRYALLKCGIGFTLGAAGEIIINGWDAYKFWAAGGIGCVAGIVGGWGIIRHMIKIMKW